MGRPDIHSTAEKCGVNCGDSLYSDLVKQAITIRYPVELAEGVRFELTVDLRPRRFSRPLP